MLETWRLLGAGMIERLEAFCIGLVILAWWVMALGFAFVLGAIAYFGF